MRLIDEPHHDGSALYVSTLTPALGERVTVWARIPRAMEVTAVHVRATYDGEPHFAAAQIDPDRTGRAIGGYGPADVWWKAEVTAHNPVTPYRFYLRRDTGRPVWLTAAGVVGHDLPDTTDFRLVTHAAPPDWTGESIIYQIFPDRFARSAQAGPPDPAGLPEWALPREWDRDEVIGRGPGTAEQFFGGDLDGITEHLDHIQSLGADTVYLTPVFPARSNHRYDASTFDTVDPLLGGDEALRRLSDALHARGMRLVGDITTNHCGDAHEWFAAASSDVAAPEREMFYFDPETGDYESWCGVKSLPKLNWGSPLVHERMIATLRHWLGTLDGWRVDVANMTGRRGADEYTHEVAALLRREIAAVLPEATLVAEHAHDAAGDLDRDGWHGTMNYLGFTRPVWRWLRGAELDLPDFLGVPGGVPEQDGPGTLDTVRVFGARMSWRSLTHSWQLLDSHDTARIRTVTGSREGHLVAAGLQATLPGVPMIYAGSEYGLTGWNGENARTPMPWNRPDDRDETTLEAYQALFGLRRSEPALRHGGLRWLHADADSLVFLRETVSESLLVSARRAAGDPVTLPLGASVTGVYGTDDLAADAAGEVTLPGDGPSLRIWRLGRAPHM
jgi:alpha-glucosidase